MRLVNGLIEGKYDALLNIIRQSFFQTHFAFHISTRSNWLRLTEMALKAKLFLEMIIYIWL